MKIYEILREHYGDPRWWSDDPYRVMFESILVQQTVWSSVEKVSESLKDKLSPSYIESLCLDELIETIRPCGFSKRKAETIKALTAWYKTYDYDIEKARAKGKEELRRELLALKGIGEETADVILVFSLNKPSFIVDAYTRRFLSRLGFDFQSDSEIRAYFESTLENDYKRFGYIHWLILDHSIRVCKKEPICKGCPFKDCKFMRK